MAAPPPHARRPRFVDLAAIARALEGDSSYSRLGSDIRKAIVAQSCLADLRQAAACLEALDIVLACPVMRTPVTNDAVEHSLLFTGILLYARATSTSLRKDGDRGSIQVASSLREDQRVAHEHLIEIRNQALAHVYLAKDVAGSVWHSSVLFLVEQPAGWLPGSGTNAVRVSKSVIEELRQLVPAAAAIILTRFHERLQRVTDVLNQKVPVEEFEANLFDPVERFGSEECVKEVLEGISRGGATFIRSTS